MPHQIDLSVGKHIRHRRWELGISQQHLAEKVGIKFQQIQKYETGTNRVSASRLWDIATALNVPITYFFPAPYCADPPNDEPSSELRQITRTVAAMTSDQRAAIVRIIQAAAPSLAA